MCLVKNEIPINQEAFQFLLQFSPPDKQQRILRQRVKQNADNMVIGGALARYMLWTELGIPFDAHISYGEFGKPYLSDYQEVHFNISHSGQFIACAVSNRLVGVDVQMITPYQPDIAAKVCDKAELIQIEASTDPAAEFTKIWTRKEAVAKVFGWGIQKIATSVPYFPYEITSVHINGAFLSVSEPL